MPRATITPLVKGLFTEGAHQYPPSVTNEVLNVNVSELVPAPGASLAANNPLDAWLAGGAAGSVRLFFGQGPNQVTPTRDWLALGSVTMHDPTDNKDATVCRWWEADVQAAQRAAVREIAARYDGLIPLIFIANGGTIYAEPFIRDIQDATSRQHLLAAGYTAALDQASYTAGYHMFSAFQHTRLAQAFNPFQYVRPDGTAGVDVAFTISMMDAFCTLYPRRAVLQNNSIRIAHNWPSPDYYAMYDHMKMLHDTTGRAVRFQTATKPRVGSFTQVLDWAILHGAHAVELTPGFQDCSSLPCLTAAELAHYDAVLRSVAG